MEQDAISLDARGLKLKETLLDALEIFRIEAGIVVGFAGGVGRAVKKKA
jgi:hypothetical protein